MVGVRGLLGVVGKDGGLGRVGDGWDVVLGLEFVQGLLLAEHVSSANELPLLDEVKGSSLLLLPFVQGGGLETGVVEPALGEEFPGAGLAVPLELEQVLDLVVLLRFLVDLQLRRLLQVHQVPLLVQQPPLVVPEHLLGPDALCFWLALLLVQVIEIFYFLKGFFGKRDLEAILCEG